MRTDATIDKRSVVCPNVGLIGYSRVTAVFGSFIRYYEGGDKTHPMYGRVAGRVHYAPACGETPEIKDWLLVVALGSSLMFPMERWVNPEWVCDAYSLSDLGGFDMVKFMSEFFGESWMLEKPADLRAWASSGWKSIEDYKANKNKP